MHASLPPHTTQTNPALAMLVQLELRHPCARNELTNCLKMLDDFAIDLAMAHTQSEPVSPVYCCSRDHGGGAHVLHHVDIQSVYGDV
jgi:hypothetical protein